MATVLLYQILIDDARSKLCPKHLKLILLTILINISLKIHSQNITLANAYAHNDYWHKRPLFDALNNGFTHIEADIYLRHGKLIVAHIFPILWRKRELEQLYFKPLQQCINGDNSEIACPAYPLMLVIDIKSGAEKTYLRLETLLQKYSSIISGYEDGIYVQRQITVVITGHKPYTMLKAEQNRLAFIDEDLMSIRQDTLASNVYQMASCRYSRMLSWTGKGNMPTAQRARLCNYVAIAHRYGEKVRLWASPEKDAVWKELLNCGVDLINTDRLVELKNFLLTDLKNKNTAAEPLTGSRTAEK